MADAKRDLTLSDSFHRVKRASLLFSVALLITFVPGLDLEHGLGVLGATLHGVAIEFVRGLLWVASLYYIAGVGMEFLIERQAHRTSLDAKPLLALRQTLLTASDQIRGRLVHLEEAAADALVHANQLDQTVELDVVRRRARTLAEAVFTHPLFDLMALPDRHPFRVVEERRTRIEGALNEIEAAGLGQNWSLREALAQLREGLVGRRQAFDDFGRQLGELDMQVSRWRNDLKGLRPAFTWRAIHFFGWELCGAVALWSLATALFCRSANWPLIGTEIAKMWN